MAGERGFLVLLCKGKDQKSMSRKLVEFACENSKNTFGPRRRKFLSPKVTYNGTEYCMQQKLFFWNLRAQRRTFIALFRWPPIFV